MKTSIKLEFIIAGIALLIVIIVIVLSRQVYGTSPEKNAAPDTVPPSIAVTAVSPQSATLPMRVFANGNVVPWQESSIGSEANGLRLSEVKVNVGDKVRKGQWLATFAAETVEAELAQSRANVAEADVALVESVANAERASALKESGTLSTQQIQHYSHAERTALAKLDAARAVERMHQLRLLQTRIIAPDDGVISARMASVGAVVPTGQELFRLIRGGRLEWRAEVAAADLVKLKPGQKARILSPSGKTFEGNLRKLAPVIDIQTRNGLVYVDLPPSDTIRAGMFAKGEFEVGLNTVNTLPQSAVLLRDGFTYVMRIGPNSRVIQTKVLSGRRFGNYVEILEGLDNGDRVVESGLAFLTDGDLVHVVHSTKPASPKTQRLSAVSGEGVR